MSRTKTYHLTLMAVLTALSVVLAFIHVPTPTGYLTLLDVSIYFTAYYLGSKYGAVVGGLSGFLIDLLLGYPQYMFHSLIAHGAQGYFAGWTGKKRILGLILASILMVGWYFLATFFRLWSRRSFGWYSWKSFAKSFWNVSWLPRLSGLSTF